MSTPNTIVKSATSPVTLTVADTIRAMCKAQGLSKVVERKMLKSIGETVEGEAFELDEFTVPDDAKSNAGKTYPMVKMDKIVKKLSGSQAKFVVEHIAELLQFALDYQETFKIDFKNVDFESLAKIVDEVQTLIA